MHQLHRQVQAEPAVPAGLNGEPPEPPPEFPPTGSHFVARQAARQPAEGLLSPRRNALAVTVNRVIVPGSTPPDSTWKSENAGGRKFGCSRMSLT